LEADLDRVHDAQKDAGPKNRPTYTAHRTAWGNARDGYLKSIRTSPNAALLENREKELRQQIDDLKRRERALRDQLK